MKHAFFVIISVYYLILLNPSHAAEQIPVPGGPVILTISGNIENRNSDKGAVFDREMLQGQNLAGLSWTKIHSATAWTTGKPEFEGVLLKDVLSLVGASGKQIIATALNDYSITIPYDHISKYKILLAMKMNGKAMRVRDKGPIWIIYPTESTDKSKGNPLNNLMVWQLSRLDIK